MGRRCVVDELMKGAVICFVLFCSVFFLFFLGTICEPVEVCTQGVEWVFCSMLQVVSFEQSFTFSLCA